MQRALPIWLQSTERPDVVAASLLEGRVVILVDATPFVLIAPMNFWSALQSAEDNVDGANVLASPFPQSLNPFVFNASPVRKDNTRFAATRMVRSRTS